MTNTGRPPGTKAADTAQVLLESLESNLHTVRDRLSAEGPNLPPQLQDLLRHRLAVFEHLVAVLAASMGGKTEDAFPAYERRILKLEAGLAGLETSVPGDTAAEVTRVREELDTLEAQVLGAQELLKQYRDGADPLLVGQLEQLKDLARRLARVEHGLSSPGTK
jgi:uncharacterized protein YicC (UPF0701 family)